MSKYSPQFATMLLWITVSVTKLTIIIFKRQRSCQTLWREPHMCLHALSLHTPQEVEGKKESWCSNHTDRHASERSGTEKKWKK